MPARGLSGWRWWKMRIGCDKPSVRLAGSVRRHQITAFGQIAEITIERFDVERAARRHLSCQPGMTDHFGNLLAQCRHPE